MYKKNTCLYLSFNLLKYDMVITFFFIYIKLIKCWNIIRFPLTIIIRGKKVLFIKYLKVLSYFKLNIIYILKIIKFVTLK
jgi:hypothetical protein